MNGGNIERMEDVIAYIETHLSEKPELKRIADEVHYSKYHLHRMFTNTTGMTLHDYIQRRQLTEAAKLLVCSRKSVLEIALMAGFESQQAFTDRFKAMYKQPPAKYRERGSFYPLQLAFSLERDLPDPKALAAEISYASAEDIPEWMHFVSLVIDGFPGFREGEHLARLQEHIERREALLLRAGAVLVGAAAYTGETGSIDFLGIHPQYRRTEAAGLLLDFMLCKLPAGREVSITTFREGDRADTGQRKEYRRLGFAEAELLTEFGYPTQRMVLRN